MPKINEMPPVPCPDCMHPTTFDEDVFVCSNCQQVFSTPNGMDLSMWQELWRAWTAGRAAVEYRHEVDYLADQLRQYIDRTLQEGVDYMREGVEVHPGLAERMLGYEAAVEDMQTMLRDPNHQFHRGLRRYITAAREVPRGR